MSRFSGIVVREKKPWIISKRSDVFLTRFWLLSIAQRFVGFVTNEEKNKIPEVETPGTEL
jgi:hypothetical protein